MARRKRPYWTLDCETDPFHSCVNPLCTKCQDPGESSKGRIPQPFVWGLYGGPDGDEYHQFDTVDEVVSFLENLDHTVYAHNGGRFDYNYLRERANTDEPVSIIAGRLAKFRIGVCEFRDSYNILPVPLKTFKKETVDYGIFEPEERVKPHNREIICKYLRSDCVYLHELITEHRKENGVSLTQAGASMRAWSKMSGIKPPRQSAGDFRTLKEHYYGGRVQCFEQGSKSTRFVVLDINSAYPYAMLSPHPFSTTPDVSDHLPPEGELHKCMIELTCVARGCFPLRNEVGELYFPDDERQVRRYKITGYEFMMALKLNAIRNIDIKSVYYFDEAITFEEFILTNWDRRAAAKKLGNKALDIIIKLLMNSLYGKFASDYEKYQDYKLGHNDDRIAFAKELYEMDARWGDDLWLFSRKIAEEKHRYFNVATAGSITGYVRAMLYEAQCQVSGLIYCDTDSIACETTGSLILGDGLGQWKNEGSFDHYAVAGKKMYAFHKAGSLMVPCTHKKRCDCSFVLDDKDDYKEYKVACKGVDLNPHEILRVCQGETVTYRPEAPTYSVKKNVPQFINRDVRMTAKDIRHMSETVTEA